MAFSTSVLRSICSGSRLVVDAWPVLGGAGPYGPACDGFILAGLTLWLAREEFRTELRGRRISRNND